MADGIDEVSYLWTSAPILPHARCVVCWYDRDQPLSNDNILADIHRCELTLQSSILSYSFRNGIHHGPGDGAECD